MSSFFLGRANSKPRLQKDKSEKPRSRREREKLSNGYISPYSLVRGIDGHLYALSVGAVAAVFTNPSWAFGLFFAFFAHRSPQALHSVLGPCGPYCRAME